MNEDLPEFNLTHIDSALTAGKRYWVFIPSDDYGVVYPVDEIPDMLPLKSHVLDIADEQVRQMAEGQQNLVIYYGH